MGEVAEANLRRVREKRNRREGTKQQAYGGRAEATTKTSVGRCRLIFGKRKAPGQLQPAVCGRTPFRLFAVAFPGGTVGAFQWGRRRFPFLQIR